MAKIFVGYGSKSGFRAASSKEGLSKETGLSVFMVRKNLGGAVASSGKTGGEMWMLGEVEVRKVEGRGITGYGGFLGMKGGKDGLLKGNE